MSSHAAENFLKALYSLSENTGEVNVNELSQHLDIKMPTVTSMAKKLAEKKFLEYEKYKPLKLTEEGYKEAGLIVRKHRLTEMFLVEAMGFGWEEVHEIAEQIEHIKAPLFFEKMDEMLGCPEVDPHGSPIPDKNGLITRKKYTKLSECEPGSKLHLTAVISSSSEFLNFLNSRDIELGMNIEVISSEPFDGTMIVNYNDHQAEMLSEKVCERLLGERE